MIELMIAFAVQAVSPVAPAVAAPAPARRLQDVPGIAITYRDLTERDVKAINKSLSKNKPLTPDQQALLGASTNWTAGGSMARLTKGAVCTVTRMTPSFNATATLPRFNEAWIPAKDLPAWRSYRAATEAQAAAKLWFPYDRLPTIQQAVIGKPCDQADRDGAAAMDRLKAEAAAFQPPIEAVQGAPAPLPAGAVRPAPAKASAPTTNSAPPPVQAPSGY